MLEAHIEITDELAARGFRRAMRPTALPQIAGYYGNRLAILWVVIAITDGIAEAGNLIFYHLMAMIGFWIVATLVRYQQWSKEVEAVKGWGFYARLDEDGVSIRHAPSEESRRSWSSYKNYVEYETYLQIEDADGNFSFLPKDPQLFQLIEFTKQKISEK